MPNTVHALAAGALAAAVVGGGCVATTPGEKGELEFYYQSTDFDFDKPIAVGATLDLHVREPDSNQAAEVLDATPTAPGILDVAGQRDDVVELEGVAEGEGNVEVEARLPSGDEVRDRLAQPMRTATVDSLELSHHCVEGQEAAYLVDTEAAIGFDMSAGGEEVIGGDFLPVSGGASLRLEPRATLLHTVYVQTPSQKTTVTLESEVDDTTATFHVVEEADIDGVVRDLGPSDGSIRVDRQGLVHVAPEGGEHRVCWAVTEGFEASSDTPGICEVAPVEADDVEEALDGQPGFVRVTGLEPGTCEMTARFPNGRDGQGASGTFQLEIVQP